MSQAASISAQNIGLWLSEGLTRMSHVYEIPTCTEELHIGDRGRGLQGPAARNWSCGRGFKYFWDGDFETSVAVTLPKFEAAARALLREIDEGIYKVQVGKDPGVRRPVCPSR